MGCVGRPPVEVDELVEHWTVLEDEQQLVAGKRGATRLGFALLLKFYTRSGRFPRGRSELPQEAVDFVARQMKVPAGDLGFYEWSGSTIEYHRAQIRQHLGYRECGVTDAERLTTWLVEHVTQAERSPERVREELLARCRLDRVEPPTGGRLDRIVRSALRLGEETLTGRVSARLKPAAREAILALIGPGTPETVDGDDEDGGESSLLGTIKEAPGNVSLETMLIEIDKLAAVRAIGLPAGLFGDVAPKVVAAWRGRAAIESPSPADAPDVAAADVAGRVAARAGTGDHRHAGGPADRHRAPDLRPGGEEGHHGAGQRLQTGGRQGKHPVPGRRGIAGRTR